LQFGNQQRGGKHTDAALETAGVADAAQIMPIRQARAAALEQISSETEATMLVDAAAAATLRERLAEMRT
jgi:hypothetical protein